MSIASSYELTGADTMNTPAEQLKLIAEQLAAQQANEARLAELVTRQTQIDEAQRKANYAKKIWQTQGIQTLNALKSTF